MGETNSFSFYKFALRVVLSVSILYIALWLISIIISSLSHGMNVDTYPANGTFQLYNPLRRIMQGEAPGKDFPFFHGVGVPWIHFPIYIIFGQNIFAAEVAKHLVSPIFFLISIFLFFYATFRNLNRTIIASALTILLASVYVPDAILPGNSMVGLRSTFPILVAGALLWKTSRAISVKKFTIKANVLVAIILLGAAFICGTEQALGAIFAFGIIRIIVRTKDIGLLRSIVPLCIELGLIVVSILAFTTIATLGHPVSALQYALVSIPADQSWYFGAPPNGHLTAEAFVYSLVSPSVNHIWHIVIAGFISSIIFFKHRTLRPGMMLVMLFVSIYGLVVFLVGITGYFAPGSQLIPLQKCAVLIVGFLLTLILFELIKTKKTHKVIFGLNVVVYILITWVLSIGTVSTLNNISSFSIAHTIKSVPKAIQSDDYSVLSQQWKSRVDTLLPNIEKGTSVWSTYTSVYDSILEKLNPSSGGEDYIIHALGDDRRANYLSQFIRDKPKYVISMNPSFFAYEEWLWTSTWGFYNHLLTHYKVVSLNDSHVLWTYVEPRSSIETKDNTIAIENKTAKLPPNPTNKFVVYQVTISYKATGGTSIAALNKIPRYLIRLSDNKSMKYTISLPSEKTSWTFPVIVEPGNNGTVLSAYSDGILPSSDLSVFRYAYKEISIPEQNQKYFKLLEP